MRRRMLITTRFVAQLLVSCNSLNVSLEKTLFVTLTMNMNVT